MQRALIRTAAWPAILAAVTLAGSLWASCLMPFTALAVICAATLPFRTALVAVAAAWAVNQALGFSLLGFGTSQGAALQGVFLLTATLAALIVGRAVVGTSTSWLRLAGAFVAGFAAFELTLLASSQVNAMEGMFAPAIVAQVGLSEALWFALLVALGLLAQRAAPGLGPQRPLARPA